MRMKLGQLVNDLFLKVVFIETIVKGFFLNCLYWLNIIRPNFLIITCYNSCPLQFVLWNSSGKNVNI